MGSSAIGRIDGGSIESGSSGAGPEDRIAVVGIGCRFPGDVDGPAAFWDLLASGRDAVTEVPPDRWDIDTYYATTPATPGRTASKWGGFLRNLDLFDASFFGMSPREAACVDPQHRLLLELAWEALEDAGIPPDRLRGSQTGVYVGISTQDYGLLQSTSSERPLIDAYTNAGAAMCMAANRISYAYDFHGPSFIVDTACSSSLVAVHLACEALRHRDCTMALVGGANAIFRPESTIGFSQASMLSPTGRCRSFDARADGYVRAEGGAVAVLKPLGLATRDGDRVYAVIRATAANHDGRTNGIALPNGDAQAAMLREAYQKADVRPAAVQYVEAHGTGTPVGDPIEAHAIGSVLAEGRGDDDPCWIGSVKSNIGHLEAAAGMAGIVKVALSLHHAQIPATLHFEHGNPHVDFAALRLRVPTALAPWPRPAHGPRIAGVNSFGFGGTNAHAVLEEAPRPAEPSAVVPAPEPLVIPCSARSSEALAATAAAWAVALSTGDAALPAIARTAALHRAHHEHRLAIVAASTGELAQRLRDHADGHAAGNMLTGRTRSGAAKLAFVFSGMGPQRWGMGRELLESSPVFARAVRTCDELFAARAGWSLWQELTAPEALSTIDRTAVAQPALFALQVGLAAVWRELGIEPDVVVGHSLGEIAAAHAAGALSLEDAATVIYHRSRLQQTLAGRGGMAAIGLPAAEIEPLLDAAAARVSIAAINSPSSVTISGESDAIEAVLARLGPNVFHRWLAVEVPYHSPCMVAIRDELEASLAGLAPHAGRIPMVSTVTGMPIDGAQLTAAYWWRNVREPVQFAPAVMALDQLGVARMVEVGPHPVLASSIAECIPAARSAVVAASLRGGASEQESIRDALARLWIDGQPVAWERLCPPAPHAPLPGYPWQREQFWRESAESRQNRLGLTVHPLLGTRTRTAMPTWSVSLDPLTLPYLADHMVHDAVVYPGTAYVEMAIAAGRQLFGELPLAVEELRLEKVNILSPGAVSTAQIVCDPKTGGFEIFSLPAGGSDGWVRHASGRLRRLTAARSAASLDREPIQARCPLDGSPDDCYRRFADLGLPYGPSFRGIQQIRCGDGEAIAQVRTPDALRGDRSAYCLHPAVFDACWQVLVGTLTVDQHAKAQAGSVYLPVGVDAIRVWRPLGDRLWCHAVAHAQDRSAQRGDVLIYDEAGELAVEVRGILCRRLGAEHTGVLDPAGELVYRETWAREPLPGAAPAPIAHALVGPAAIAAQLAPEVARLVTDLERARYYSELEPRTHSIAVEYMLHAFDKLGGSLVVGQSITVDAAMATMRVDPTHRRFLRRLLLVLEAERILAPAPAPDGWTVAQLPPRLELSSGWASWSDWSGFAAYYAELRLMRRCGERLAEVLSGEQNPLELLFPDGSLDAAEYLYQDAPTYRIYNHFAQMAVSAALARRPRGARFRILEIGGGTGGMTAHMLAGLPADGCSYRFTDVSAGFLPHAERKFRRYPFVEYGTLDLEADLADQGYLPGSFDLILASDVLHTTADLREALAGVRRLLAPAGMLVVLEGSRAPYWALLSFGMLKGWWKFTDEALRGEDPWVPRRVWDKLFEDVGFTEIACLTDHDGDDALHNVMIARLPGGEPAQLAAAPAAPAPSPWLILGGDDRLGDEVAQQLEALGHTVTLTCEPVSLPAMRDLLARTGPLRGILYLRTAALPAQNGAEMTLHAQDDGSIGVVLLVRALVEAQLRPAPRLWIATRGAKPIDAPLDRSGLAQAPIWGVGRVVANEAPELQCTLVDLAPAAGSAPAGVAAALVAELCAETAEREVALREHRYVHRVIRERPVKCAGYDDDLAFHVEIATPGILSTLRIEEIDRRPPGPAEIEVRVSAACLNFKDVAVVMGLLPEDAFEAGHTGRALGIEAAGEVVAVGSDVIHLAPGDQVTCFAPHALASHVTMEAGLAIPCPEGHELEAAVTMPVAFATASYALHHLARLQRGESVLIHAAAGGVGLAAVQLAALAGAEVYATAGSADKRDFLYGLGVRHVFDSRSLEFVDDVERVTGGRGVDVVLNSLAGQALTRGLGVLADGGRFVEIGKQDIYTGGQLPLTTFRRNLSFFAVDLDRLMRDKQPLVGQLAQDIFQMATDGRLQPLPYRVFSMDAVADAFRYMAQAKHIGRVVVSRRTGAALRVDPDPSRLRLDPHGTYLITGGLGGFGLETARWLITRGARHLALVGRRGAGTPQVRAGVDSLSAMGANVVVAAADVTDPEALAEVLASVRRDLPPLRGVIHAAMVLDDAFLQDLDRERVLRALAPKMAGAWNLHTQTLEDPLDLFIMYSSMTAVLGSPGQANYAAGNAFLDALAVYRRGQGLPATSVNWGVVSNVGFVAERPDLSRNVMDRLGARGLPARVLLDLLSVLIQAGVEHACVADINWAQLATNSPIAQSPLMAHLVASASGDAPAISQSQRDALLAVDGEGRGKLLEQLLCAELANVLGTTPGLIDPSRPLMESGLDSLMAFELKSRLESALGITVSPMKLMQGATAETLARALADELATVAGATTARSAGPPAAASPATGAPSLADVRAQVEALPDSDVDALLREELARGRLDAQEPP